MILSLISLDALGDWGSSQDLAALAFGFLGLRLEGLLGLGCFGFGVRLFFFLDLLLTVILPIRNRHVKPLEGDALPGLPIQWPFLEIAILVEASPGRAWSSSRLMIQLAETSLGGERYILVNRTEPAETDCVELKRKLHVECPLPGWKKGFQPLHSAGSYRS